MWDGQIGGDFYCPKCKRHCSGAKYHDCPEDRKQTKLATFKEEIEKTRKLRKELKKKGMLFDTK